MPFGLLTGLSAALAWGTLDVITALGSRVVGSLRVTAGMQFVTAVIFAAMVVMTGTTLKTGARSTTATVGVLLPGLAFDGGLRSVRFAGPGVVFAVIALVLFSLMAITTDIALETMTWLQTYSIARGVNASIGIVAIVILTSAGHRLGGRPGAGAPWSPR